MSRRCQPWLGVLMGVLALAGRAEAHQPDTSYARFKASREGLELRFTYDLVSLIRIVPDLDANADHQITPDELAAQAPKVVEYLRNHIEFEIDGAEADFGKAMPVRFPPDVGEAIAEADYHAASSLVHFDFAKPLAKPPADFWVQFTCFEELGSRHTILGAIEHEGDEHEVIFRYYEPDYLFDTGYLPAPSATPAVTTTPAAVSPTTVVAAPPATVLATAPLTELPLPPAAEPNATTEEPVPAEPRPDRHAARSNTNPSWWGQTVSFFWLGVEHIFLGYDHILFLLSLIVVCKLRELLKIVTSFTVAHTITLILATLDVVQLPGRLVETAIAATIVYVAVENFWVQDTTHRWKLTFVFGLIHGFGFAGVLRELGLPTAGLVRSLIAFNVGVEAGQVAIVLVLFPLVVAVTRWKHGKYVQRTMSGLIALCGLCWFIDRLFALGWMPF